MALGAILVAALVVVVLFARRWKGTARQWEDVVDTWKETAKLWEVVARGWEARAEQAMKLVEFLEKQGDER